MKAPEIKVIFRTVGGDFSLEEFSQEMNMEPSRMRKRGQKTKSGTRENLCTLWERDIVIAETYDLALLLDYAITILAPKMGVLKTLRHRMDIEYSIDVVIMIHETETPAFVLKPKVIKFLYDLHATLDCDMYVNRDEPFEFDN